MTITAAQIIQFVETNREEALKCLIEIIQTPSVTGEEEAVSHVFTRWMEREGLTVSRHQAVEGRPNLLAEWHGSQRGKRFVLNGHMDVFPPDAKDSGPYGPWAGKIVDGKLYGRGAADMKGGDCGALMAVLFLRRMGFDPKGSVLLSFMCDEENGGGLGVQYMLKEGLLNGDFGLCMEPTCGKLLVTHGGILRAFCTYTAEAQHSSIRYAGGSDALKKAVRAIHELYKIDERLSKIQPSNFSSPCLSVTMLQAGTAPNVHPSKAVFAIDRRLVPGEHHQEALDEIVEVLEQLRKKDPSYEYQLEVTSRRPFLDIPEEDPFIKIVANSYKQIMGKPVEIYRRAGGSDAANIREVTGMPIPNFGAALDVEDSCSPSEKIDVQDYLDFIKIYMMTIVNALS